jgi:hypothetical protein
VLPRANVSVSASALGAGRAPVLDAGAKVGVVTTGVAVVAGGGRRGVVVVVESGGVTLIEWPEVASSDSQSTVNMPK